ncbi:MAG: hypothetical protein WA975_23515 [Mesorhizobium sp.]
MRELILGMSLIAASSAFADEADYVARSAAVCWDLPAGTEPVRLEFDIVLDDGGFLKDATVRTLSGAQSDRILVMTAVRALAKCSPFPGAADKELRITMDPAQIPKKTGPIDPFK